MYDASGPTTNATNARKDGVKCGKRQSSEIVSEACQVRRDCVLRSCIESCDILR